MPYCTIADINQMVRQAPFSSTTTPSQADVEQFIADIAVEMDSLLNLAGYVIPVTAGPNALALLRNANKYGAMGMAQDARYTAVQQDATIGGQRNVWTQRWMDWKKSVTDNKVFYDLIDAQRTNLAIVKPVGSIESDTTSISKSYLRDPPFKMGHIN